MRFVLGMLLIASAAASAADSPLQAVARLYHDFAWEAVLAEPHTPGLAQQPKAVLLRYFTPQLAAALAADASCASRSGESCALDFMPLWASQDPAAVDLSIAQGAPGTVRVEFRSPSSGQAVVLVFRVVSTSSGWRVADIAYPEGRSLVTLLSKH